MSDEELIKLQIEAGIYFGKDKPYIIDLLMRKFNISDKLAWEYVQRYWK